MLGLNLIHVSKKGHMSATDTCKQTKADYWQSLRDNGRNPDVTDTNLERVFWWRWEIS